MRKVEGGLLAPESVEGFYQPRCNQKLMALQLIKAVTDGTRRVLTRTGGILLVLLLVQQLLLVTSINTLLAAEAPPAVDDVIGLTIPVPGTVAGAILIGALVFSGVYFVTLSRAFARPLSQLSSFPTELYTRRVGRATLSTLVGGTIVFIAVMIGIAFVFVPGLFLSACFLFFIFTVGVEDRSVIGALKRSWGLSKGNRLRLIVIVLIFGVAGALVGVVSTFFQLAGAPALGDVASVLLNSVFFTVAYGIMAAAYLQLARGDGGPSGPQSSARSHTKPTPEV
jgi:hypothetical protein